MCLFLWQASVYPVQGQWSNNGTWSPNDVAKVETKQTTRENNNSKGAEGMTRIIVQRGETLWSLAQMYQTTVDELVKINRIKSPNQIREGDPMWVPRGEEILLIDSAQPKSTIPVSAQPVAVTTDQETKVSWWISILRSIPAFATVGQPRTKDTPSGDPQPLTAETEIPTYEVIVNEDTQLLDKTESQTAEVVKTGEQKVIQAKATPVPQGTEDETQILSRSLGHLVSKADVELMARVIYAEARGENFDGQVAVGAVVLNRLRDPRFPKTIRDIIYQPGAFTAVNDRQIHLDPDDGAYKAAEAALSGVDPTSGAIYYYNPRIATDRWIKSRPVVKRIGNHTFSI